MMGLKTMVNDYETLTEQLLEWIRVTTDNLNDTSLPNSLTGIELAMADFQDYKTVEKPQRLKEKCNIEDMFVDIQAHMKENNQNSYNPADGCLIKDIESAWIKLERSEQERETVLRHELLRQEEKRTETRKLQSGTNMDSEFENSGQIVTDFHTLSSEKQNEQDIEKQKCKFHTDENQSLYCENHSDFICGRCLLSDHKRCFDSVVDINNKTQTFDNIKRCMDTLKQLAKEIDTNIAKTKDIIKQNDNCKANYSDDISKFHKRLVERLDILKTETEKEMNLIHKQNEDNLAKALVSFSESKRLICERNAKLESLLQQKLDKNAFVALKLIEKETREYKGNHPSFQHYTFNRSKKVMITKDLLQLGTLTEEECDGSDDVVENTALLTERHSEVTSSKHQKSTIQDGTRQKTFEQFSKVKFEVQTQFVAVQFAKERFRKLKQCCETIDGILTICCQDVADVSMFLNEQLISGITASSVQIYTTEEFEHHFEQASSAKDQNMSIHDVVEKIQHTHEFALIVLDGTQQGLMVKTLQEAIPPTAGILVVGESVEIQNMPSVNVMLTHPNTIVEDADIILERCAFAILKILHSKLKLFGSEKTISGISEQMQMCFLDIDDLIMTIFRNSAIPRSDWPEAKQQPIEYPINIDKAIEELVCLPTIIWCLKKRGILQIYVSAETNERDQNDFRRALEKYSIAKYHFVYGASKLLFSSGDSIFGGRGTLGGFVKKLELPIVDIGSQSSAGSAGARRDSANTNDFTLTALISRHVVHETNRDMLTVGTHQTPIGRIGTLNDQDVIDILPVDVEGVELDQCDPCFITELNVRMRSRLKRSADIRELIGKPVHIWSAGSKPGIGLLVEQDFIASNGLRIIIRDRRIGTPFAKEGDSGAMICYQDPDTEVLYAVAMLVSEVQLQQYGGVRYTAQILDDGLQKLSVINNCQFVLFEDSD